MRTSICLTLTNALPAHPGVHFYGNLPVRWVRIVGVIVGIDDFPEKRVYTIDDSSGLNVQCVLPLDARQESTSKVLAPGPLIPSEYSELDVGHVVDLRGPIVPYRRQRAINIRRMKRVPTTQHELLLWERRLKFKTEVIDVPWALSDEEIRGYRRKAGQAAAKDLNLAVTKRKRGAQRVDGQGAGTGHDPFKIRKGGTKLASASSHKGARRSGETLNGTNVPAHSKPVSTSQREAPSQPCGDKLDPYSIKAKKATRPALPAAPRATPSRRSSIHDDPFRVTKQGSGRTFKVPIQSPARPSVEPLPAQENLLSGVSQSNSAPNTRASGGSRVQHPSVDQDLMGRAESPEPSHREASTPAPKSKTQHAVLAGAADDPYVIKARGGSRRASTKPTASEWRTSAGLSKTARPRKGPCSEKSPNADPMSLSKRTYPLARDLKNSQRHGGSGTRFDVDDPFKITKLAGREHSMRL